MRSELPCLGTACDESGLGVRRVRSPRGPWRHRLGSSGCLVLCGL